jgi:hypothetical protein
MVNLAMDISRGINAALETVVFQAFGASLNVEESQLYREEMRQLSGRYLNLARLMNTLFLIVPTVVLFLFADEILINFCHLNARVSE